MGQPTTIQVTCPACGHEQTFQAWQSINATTEPDLKQRLLDGELTTCTCGGCNREAHVTFGLLYHDMEKRVMIWLVPGDESTDDIGHAGLETVNRMTEEGYTFRLVRTQNELVEKILIFDDGLDDRVIELFKFAIWNSLVEGQRPQDGSMFYSGATDTESGERIMELVLFAETGQTSFEVPWEEAFRTFESEVAPVIADAGAQPGPWPRIDQAFAQALLRR
jgi:hypothetical protein